MVIKFMNNTPSVTIVATTVLKGKKEEKVSKKKNVCPRGSLGMGEKVGTWVFVAGNMHW